MITFTGYMYNTENGEWLGLQPEEYSFGYYMGHDLVPGTSDGKEDIVIPRADITYNRATNIGCKFEEHAKRYFDEHAEYPRLRIYKTLTEQSYIEWDPAAPNGFNIHTIGGTFRWEHVYIWVATTGLFKPCVFVSEGDEHGLMPDHNVWSGCCLDTSQDPTLYVGYPTQSINIISTPAAFISSPTTLATVLGATFFKTVEAPVLAFFAISNTWAGPFLMGPANGTTGRETIPPFNASYVVSGFNEGPYIYIGNYFSVNWSGNAGRHSPTSSVLNNYETNLPVIDRRDLPGEAEVAQYVLSESDISVTYMQVDLFAYLMDNSQPESPEPPSDVDPDDIPPADDPPAPIPPDDPDPYYDPTSDPDNPDYDPEKDPNSPDYDPDTPHTPWRPVSGESPNPNPNPLPPEDTIPVPVQPPVFASSNKLLTLYNPVQSELDDLANFLWSPTWTVDTFKKIFANPLDAILGLMVMPTVPATVSQRELSIGNIPTGITMRYFTQQFVDYPCGSFTIGEYYGSYLDYAPYTKVVLMLPYIGECKLNTDEVMNKTIDVTYRFDVSTGTCVAFVKVDGSLLYTFNGMAVASIPISANGWGSMISGLLSMPIKAVAVGASTGTGPMGTIAAASALSVMSMKEEISHTGNLIGSAGLMGIQKPYLIITRPRQVIPANQNSYTGYPSFMTESLGSLSGYTEVEQCHLEHVPATGEELAEIEQLLKEGVLF